MPPSSTLSVVIPAYNEEDGIAETVERVLAVRPALAELDLALELIVVDDGSHDRTGVIVQSYVEAHEGVRLLCHNPNRGYGAALKTGFAASCGDLLAFLDADGTYPPTSLPDLCRETLNGADVVVGSRRSGAASGMPLVRKLGNFVWANLVTTLSGQRVLDPASGMRVFKRAVLNHLYPLPDGLNFTPVMSTRAIHEGLTFVEIPMPYEERRGRSKLSVVRDGLRFLQTIIWTALTYNPARLLGGLGFGLFALGSAIALLFIGMRISGVTELSHWGVTGVFTAMILGVVGFDLFALGATFNYLVALFNRDVVQKGLFGQPIFDPPLDHHFGWMGLLSLVGGSVVGVISLVLGLNGWLIERLWLYLLASAMGVIMGIQLVVFWTIIRVLEQLSVRDQAIQADWACTYDA